MAGRLGCRWPALLQILPKLTQTIPEPLLGRGSRFTLPRSATLCETQKSKKMVPKWSWTTFWWIFPSGQEMVEKWSENGPRETAYITQWSKNGRKMVPGRPQTIFGVLFDHFLTIFLQIENPKGAAAEGRRPLWGAAGGRPSIWCEKY